MNEQKRPIARKAWEGEEEKLKRRRARTPEEVFRGCPKEEVGSSLICHVKDYLVLIDKESLHLFNKGTWRISAWGYILGRVDNMPVYYHKFIVGSESGEKVDHINGLTFDNRRNNLRKCSHADNIHHRIGIGVGSSKYLGVSWWESRRKWRATITLQGKQKHLGSYDTEIEAALAYKKEAIEQWGEFAPNFSY